MNQENNNKEFLASQKLYDGLFENKDHYGAEKFKHAWAGNFHRYRIKLLKNIFINILKCQPKTEILDVGSHFSMFGEIFNPKECPKVTAFDVSKTVIEEAKKMYPHIKFLVDDAQSPQLQGKWDIVFAGEIIEHLPHPKEALKKWDNLLKKEGYLILSTPNRWFSRPNKEHISLLTIKQVKEMLEELNFEIVQIIGIDLFNDIFNPFYEHVLNRAIKRFPKIAKITDQLFQIRMGLTYKFPWFAHDIIYVAKKH
jgi:2-polyprenyl-3-methyl-5-hydroxy-6-metoxy-1,4-benzoquinol methylase